MTQNLLRVFKRHLHHFANSDIVDVNQLLQAKFIYEFDDRLTRKSFKFRTVHEYYRQASSAQYVPDIRIPMLLFSAVDDPIAPRPGIPFFEVKENPHVILALTAQGGHLGWFEGAIKPKRWFAKPVGEYISAIIEVLARQNPSSLGVAKTFPYRHIDPFQKTSRCPPSPIPTGPHSLLLNCHRPHRIYQLPTCAGLPQHQKHKN